MKETLENKQWLFKNESLIKELFPEEWTPINRLNALNIGLGLEELGVKIETMSNLLTVLSHLERIKILLRFGKKIRVNPESIFKEVK
jgi:hypothetical protein